MVWLILWPILWPILWQYHLQCPEGPVLDEYDVSL